jgi:hypothetical protein
MAKSFRFYNEEKTVDSEYITDGMLNHEVFFLTEMRGVDSVDILAGLNLEIQEYSETELKALATDLGLVLQKYNDNELIEYLNSFNNFLSFTMVEETGDAVIDPVNKTIDIEVANGTDVTDLISTFTVSDGAVVDVSDTVQESGVTSNDYTAPVVYTVTSAQGVEEDWTVTVTVAAL